MSPPIAVDDGNADVGDDGAAEHDDGAAKKIMMTFIAWQMMPPD